MKVVILAGGLGTRLAEETSMRPKPMVEIGGRPILWHIMKLYSAQGINDFIVCAGYKGYMIKEYFFNYYMHNSDVCVDLASNAVQMLNNHAEPWKVTVADTGESTMTGGRIRRVRDYVGNETFCLTYGDGVADVDLRALLEFHKKSGRLATLTGVQTPSRFGCIKPDGDRISKFQEKPEGEGTWINGGFMVLEPKVFDYLGDDTCIFEREPLERLAAEGELGMYRHHGFWKPMDALRDKQLLETMWQAGTAPWKIW